MSLKYLWIIGYRQDSKKYLINKQFIDFIIKMLDFLGMRRWLRRGRSSRSVCISGPLRTISNMERENCKNSTFSISCGEVFTICINNCKDHSNED